MKIRDYARDYFLNRDFNCAESVLLAASDYYSLGIGPDDLKLLSAFGAGMQCEQLCGALSACFAVLGRLYVEDRAHVSPRLKELGAQFYQDFQNKAGSVLCKDLKPIYRKEDTRCLDLILLASDLLEDFVQDHPVQ